MSSLRICRYSMGKLILSDHVLNHVVFLAAFPGLMMRKVSLETSPKNNTIQHMINSDNMNSAESTISNIFKGKLMIEFFKW